MPKGTNMKIETYRINKKKEKLKGRVIELDKFIKIATTGRSIALKYKKGRVIELHDSFYYDESYWEGTYSSLDDKSFNYMAMCVKLEFVDNETYHNILKYAEESNVLLYHYGLEEKKWHK